MVGSLSFSGSQVLASDAAIYDASADILPLILRDNQILTWINAIGGSNNLGFPDSITANQSIYYTGSAMAASHFIKSDVALDHDDGAGADGKFLHSDGDATTSWQFGLIADKKLTVDSTGDASGKILQSDGSGNYTLANNSATPSPSIVSSAPTTVASNTINLVTITSGTINLPSSPSTSDEPIYFIPGDAANWSTNNWTLGRNGSNIESSASDLTINTNSAFMATYVGATDGWRIVIF